MRLCLCYNITIMKLRSHKKGFTLVELLVTISIFAILTGVVLFNQGKFNSTILLTNLAYDTALTIRQAQTYGINIKGFDKGSGEDFYPYGVHFASSTNKSFILFADLDYNRDTEVSDGLYNGNGSEIPDFSQCQTNMGCVNRYNIKRGNYILDLKAGADCTGTSVNSLDITFKRPDPDAIIKANGVRASLNKACIVLKGTDGDNKRTVVVQKNGLIEIVNHGLPL